MRKDIRRLMSDKHEEFLAKRLGSQPNPGSGNQFNKQMDGRTDAHIEHFGFAWDGKATLGDGITVSVSMWEKAKEQSVWEIPLLPLRYYLNTRLTEALDLVVISLDDFLELKSKANGVSDE